MELCAGRLRVTGREQIIRRDQYMMRIESRINLLSSS